MIAQIHTNHEAHGKASINSQHCPTIVSTEYKLADHVINSKEEFSLENLTVTQLVNKLPMFYGTQSALLRSLRACHWTLF
jgi:hypothetical protein